MSQPKSAKTHPVSIIHHVHMRKVWSVSFAPDGNSVATGAYDKAIRIWDTHSSSAIGEPLTGHTFPIYSVSYSPLGDMIVSGSCDHTVRLWDTNNGRQVGEPMQGHTDNVYSVAFSPGGDLIASGSRDDTFRLWDVKKRQSVSDPFKGHTGSVHSAVFSRDGARIISGSADRTIRIWDIERRTIALGPLQGHTNWVRSVDVSPDGSQIVSGSGDNTLRLWDIRSGVTTDKPFEGHTGYVYSVSFSPSGVYVASSSTDQTICIWDVRTGRQLGEPLKRHTDEVRSVAFSPSGRHIASGSNDNTVMIWDVSRLTSDQTSDPYDMVEGNEKPLKDDGTDYINQHMSIQDMLGLLSRHGCDDLSLQMDQSQSTAVLVSGGGFGDIWKGELLDGTPVAIKAWRESLIEQCDYKILKRAAREIYYWSKLRHENIHELMGVILFKGQSLGMVSEWMENGNLHEYLRKNHGTDRFQLSIQVASGLAYIHNFDMVHGDIKAINVLVSMAGVAKLTDFGLSTMYESSIDFSATTSQAGSVRWTAPELFLGEPAKTTWSDVYALGMTILEIFTGNIPYSQWRRDYTILQMVGQGVFPTRPTSQIMNNERGNGLWDLLAQCWGRTPDARPTAKQVTESLVLISALGM
ncbi:unnamed protein product [Rhizoctonia solani]|uniref:Protein kinase domain-containing protein n=1 Tax=Rhizoctonia solani TaxID=456999 RepID=A0A8H3HEH4_9AGAM|nr:unnamed protein product [Rhizoctonia solani]